MVLFNDACMQFHMDKLLMFTTKGNGDKDDIWRQTEFHVINQMACASLASLLNIYEWKCCLRVRCHLLPVAGLHPAATAAAFCMQCLLQRACMAGRPRTA